jgi:signal transduction histidine kinase
MAQERTPSRSWDPTLIAASGVAVVVAAWVLIGSLAWIGRPFPGFLVLENGVVASAGLARWPATAGGAIYQQHVVAVDGVPIADGAALRARVARAPAGTVFQYALSDASGVRTVDVPSRRFDRTDWLLLFGTYAFCGLGLCAMALCIRFLRGRDQLANGSFPALYLVGIFALTAIDLYGPSHWFRLHALAETLLAPAVFHLALVFPRTASLLERRPRLLWLPYAAAGLLAAYYQIGLHDPDAYRLAHHVAQTAFGASLALLVAMQVWHWRTARDFEVQQRIKLVAFGSALALGPQVVLALLAATAGVEAPQNAMAFSGMLFPLSLAYAVLGQNLLGVDQVLRRVLHYAVLTLAVTGVYAGAVIGFDAAFRISSPGGRGISTLLIGPLAAMALLLLRDRVQSGIDRLFFRSAWDFGRVVETTSARLASVSDLSIIAVDLQSAVTDTLHPEWTAFYVRSAPDDQLVCVDSSCPDPQLAADLLAVATSAAQPCDGPDASLGVPFRVENGLTAVLLLGRRRSGRFYSGDDRRLLHTLANQGAVAIENALALEQLRLWNRDLEDKVAARTRDLADALRDLRETQAQLVHREKMASVGQFVAGIAHEMNNPLAFIEGNLHFLRSYSETLARAVASFEAAAGAGNAEQLAEIRRELDLEHVLEDLGSVLDACAEGVTRTTGLVNDLRSFSRLDQADVAAVDLNAALDSTLNLLRSRLIGIRLDRCYGELPAVECLAGQINQVFMNLLANAADAAGEGGRITVRTERCADDRVAVEVEDDGIGISPENLERIFDPFFTTKEPGQGTGLGLSISYGILSRHGGTLAVRSTLGAGSCFRVELPVLGKAGELS